MRMCADHAAGAQPGDDALVTEPRYLHQSAPLTDLTLEVRRDVAGG
jgi:hypothetical protein